MNMSVLNAPSQEGPLHEDVVSAMTAAQAAARVKRPVAIQESTGSKGVDGKLIYRSVVTQQEVTESEVLRFKDYGTHVVVVTTDGQKFTSAA